MKKSVHHTVNAHLPTHLLTAIFNKCPTTSTQKEQIILIHTTYIHTCFYVNTNTNAPSRINIHKHMQIHLEMYSVCRNITKMPFSAYAHVLTCMHKKTYKQVNAQYLHTLYIPTRQTVCISTPVLACVYDTWRPFFLSSAGSSRSGLPFAPLSLLSCFFFLLSTAQFCSVDIY